NCPRCIDGVEYRSELSNALSGAPTDAALGQPDEWRVAARPTGNAIVRQRRERREGSPPVDSNDQATTVRRSQRGQSRRKRTSDTMGPDRNTHLPAPVSAPVERAD